MDSLRVKKWWIILALEGDRDPPTGRRSAACLLLTLGLAGCLQLESRPQQEGGTVVEPEVFDVIRASNSHAAVQYLQDQYRREIEEARILRYKIDELVSAEAGLAWELEDEHQQLETIREQIALVESSSSQVTTELQQATQKRDAEQAALQQTRAEEEQARAELEGLRQSLEATSKERERLAAALANAEARLAELREEAKPTAQELSQLLQQLQPPAEPSPPDHGSRIPDH